MIDRSPRAEPAAVRPFSLSELPHATRLVSELLADAGHSAYWVGSSLLEMIEGRRPPSFALTTDASEQRLADLFGSAVPIADRRGTLMVPSPAGPIDVTPFRHGGEIQDELAHLDFTVHAIAYDAREGLLHDPFDGLGDLAAGRLRAVRSAADRLAEDPLRGLRAVRVAATRGLKPDPELELALTDIGPQLQPIARIRVREELVATILAPFVGQAWPLLEQSGISKSMASDIRTGAGALIEQLPADLGLRLAAWLTGARSRRALQRLRFSRPIVDRVEHLLLLHPIETRVDPSRLPAVARLSRRESARDLGALIELRRAELRLTENTGDEPCRLDALEAALSELRAKQVLEPHTRLAINGAEIMEELACGPGPNVGRALAYLSEQIAVDPDRNAPAELRALLRDWVAQGHPAKP